MIPKKQNVENENKWSGYYLEDTECRVCLYYRGKKRGCALLFCCYEDDKLNAMENGRIKRKRGAMVWDG